MNMFPNVETELDLPFMYIFMRYFSLKNYN